LEWIGRIPAKAVELLADGRKICKPRYRCPAQAFSQPASELHFTAGIRGLGERMQTSQARAEKIL
jgi:hypothetical protein